ncbi:MAG: hypothetical protein Q3988_02575 [Gemella sp.]|nr:hypothetical protein [Gemella sp.]
MKTKNKLIIGGAALGTAFITGQTVAHANEVTTETPTTTPVAPVVSVAPTPEVPQIQEAAANYSAAKTTTQNLQTAVNTQTNELNTAVSNQQAVQAQVSQKAALVQEQKALETKVSAETNKVDTQVAETTKQVNAAKQDVQTKQTAVESAKTSYNQIQTTKSDLNTKKVNVENQIKTADAPKSEPAPNLNMSKELLDGLNDYRHYVDEFEMFKNSSNRWQYKQWDENHAQESVPYVETKDRTLRVQKDEARDLRMKWLNDVDGRKSKYLKEMADLNLSEADLVEVGMDNPHAEVKALHASQWVKNGDIDYSTTWQQDYDMLEAKHKERESKVRTLIASNPLKYVENSAYDNTTKHDIRNIPSDLKLELSHYAASIYRDFQNSVTKFEKDNKLSLEGKNLQTRVTENAIKLVDDVKKALNGANPSSQYEFEKLVAKEALKIGLTNRDDTWLFYPGYDEPYYKDNKIGMYHFTKEEDLAEAEYYEKNVRYRLDYVHRYVTNLTDVHKTASELRKLVFDAVVDNIYNIDNPAWHESMHRLSILDRNAAVDFYNANGKIGVLLSTFSNEDAGVGNANHTHVANYVVSRVAGIMKDSDENPGWEKYAHLTPKEIMNNHKELLHDNKEDVAIDITFDLPEELSKISEDAIYFVNPDTLNSALFAKGNKEVNLQARTSEALSVLQNELKSITDSLSKLDPAAKLEEFKPYQEATKALETSKQNLRALENKLSTISSPELNDLRSRLSDVTKKIDAIKFTEKDLIDATNLVNDLTRKLEQTKESLTKAIKDEENALFLYTKALATLKPADSNKGESTPAVEVKEEPKPVVEVKEEAKPVVTSKGEPVFQDEKPILSEELVKENPKKSEPVYAKIEALVQEEKPALPEELIISNRAADTKTISKNDVEKQVQAAIRKLEKTNKKPFDKVLPKTTAQTPVKSDIALALSVLIGAAAISTRRREK